MLELYRYNNLLRNVYGLAKVKLSLCHAMKYGGMEVQLYTFSKSTLGGCESSVSFPTALPQIKNPRYPLDRRLHEVAKGKAPPCPCQALKPCSPHRSLFSVLTELPRL